MTDKLPLVKWAQRKDRLYITIEVIHSEKPSIEINGKTLKYKGKDNNNQTYSFEIELFDEIDKDKSKFNLDGRKIFLCIIKKNSGPYWPRLVSENKKLHWLKIDFDYYTEEDEEEEGKNPKNINGNFNEILKQPKPDEDVEYIEDEDNEDELIKETKNKLDELENEIDYKYNENTLELLHKTTGEKIGKVTQMEYEKIGDYIQKYIIYKLLNECNMLQLYVPFNKENDYFVRDKTIPQCNIFATKDFEINEKCLLLIQGTGAVRAGQWARSVCTNDNLNLGSMIPYVNKAISDGYSVIIFNPNERFDLNDSNLEIKEFNTMENHSLYIYNHIIKNNEKIKDIYIVAHSMGGECTIQILLNNENDLINNRIKKICFTDSAHTKNYLKLSEQGLKKFKEISRNYVTSKEPLNTFIEKNDVSYSGVDCYSSGHEKHEYTSGTSINAIFEYFNNN